MKRIICFAFALLLLVSCSSCACSHEWKDATCTSPKTCTLCGEKEGEASSAAHAWKAATCTSPTTCSLCGKSEGNRLGHLFADGKCSVCGAFEYQDLAKKDRIRLESEGYRVVEKKPSYFWVDEGVEAIGFVAYDPEGVTDHNDFDGDTLFETKSMIYAVYFKEREEADGYYGSACSLAQEMNDYMDEWIEYGEPLALKTAVVKQIECAIYIEFQPDTVTTN